MNTIFFFLLSVDTVRDMHQGPQLPNQTPRGAQWDLLVNEGYKFEFEFQIFVQRQVWVMGFQELCLLCYETQWLRHSQVERVAQSLLWPPATV